MKKRDKIIEEARQRFEYASEAWAPIYAQMRDDLRFSDPTGLEQWPEKVRRERELDGRPCLTFDQTGQYVRQIINQARRNKPALKFLPVDDKSDPELSEILQGLARQVEYESRAEVAYITALNHAVRGGLGFFRLITEEKEGGEVVGQQCAKIVRIVDPKSVKLDPDFQETDGSDARWGFVEETYTRDRFKALWPKANLIDWDSTGWFGLVAPAGTPASIIQKLNTEFTAALNDEGIKSQMRQSGMEPVATTTEGLDAYIKSETQKWGRVIRQANIKLN